MDDTQRKIILAVALFAIVCTILFLQSTKAAPGATEHSITTLANQTSPHNYPQAPELTGITGYINAPEGFTLSSVKGKVILVDFWTYSCINCIRTQPYLNAWYDKYKDQGLVIVGVHTPEFDFEKEISNVREAVAHEKILYPVVLDSNYGTWRAYQNQYWPRKYLIDANGYIRYDVIGEGSYEETEAKIQELLKERNTSMASTGLVAASVNATTPSQGIGTPELYLGYQFARQNIGNPEGLQPGQTVAYSLPNTIVPNVVYLGGTWKSNGDNVEAVSDTATVALSYTARSVNIVAGGDSTVRVILDNFPVGSRAGEDAPSGVAYISDQRLYNVVFDDAAHSRVVLLNVTKGFRLYTFTFG